MSESFQPHGLQHTRFPCLLLAPRVCSDSYPLSRWCYLTTSSSAALFSSCLQTFPVTRSFPMSQLFTSGGQSIEAWASTSVLPTNIQVWFPLGLVSLISLLSKGLPRVFSNTTIQKPPQRNRNARRQNGCLWRPYKWLSKEEKRKAEEKGKQIPNA